MNSRDYVYRGRMMVVTRFYAEYEDTYVRIDGTLPEEEARKMAHKRIAELVKRGKGERGLSDIVRVL